jgi:hypothetical protein
LESQETLDKFYVHVEKPQGHFPKHPTNWKTIVFIG